MSDVGVGVKPRTGAAPPISGWMPGLDGLRAVAVVSVVAFHARVPGAGGGFLGVSLFFTLSGFLITNRAIAALNRGERFRLLRFTGRRLRRLAPAAAAGVALGLIVVAIIGSGDQRAAVRTDAVWALSYLQNWRTALSGTSYAAVFTAPSPFEHYWSLAVEEQFYVFFPLVMLGVVRWGRNRMLAVVGGLGAVSVALALFSGFGSGRLYYGTDTRAWELLAGVMLALAGNRAAPWLMARPRLTTRLRNVTLVAFLVGVATIDVTGPWVTGGWFVLGPLVAVPLIAATAVTPGSVLMRSPVRQVGVWAYGIYLAHWPLQMLADHLAPTAPRVLSALVVLGVSSLLAAASLRLIENPVRFHGEPRVWAPRIAAVTLAAVLAWLAVPVPARSELVVLPRGDAGTRIELPVIAPETTPATAPTTAAPADTDPAAPTTAPTTTVPPRPDVRMVMVGDSTAFTLLLPGDSYGSDAPVGKLPPPRAYPGGDLTAVGADVRLGCGMARHDALPAKCAARWNEWDDLIGTALPDLVVLLPGQWEMVDMSVRGQGRSIEDPVVADFVRDEYVEVIDRLSSRGARVVLATNGPFVPRLCQVQRYLGGTDCDADRNNRRIEVLNRLMREAAAEAGPTAEVVELGEWLRLTDADGQLRPDGAHWSGNGAEATWVWLGPELLELMARPPA